MPDKNAHICRTIHVEREVPLAPFTSFKIGGPARYLIRVDSLDQLREALLFARGEGIPFCILGGGSNLLISDRGFDGVVIRMQLKGIRVSGEEVEVQAGVDLMALVQHTAHWGLSGLERLAGIPGLVGGAIRGNAGAYGRCIGDAALTVTALDARTLELATLEREACAFEYRNSRFKMDPQLIVVSAHLRLSPAPHFEIERKVEETVRKREARQLQCDMSAGSFFMNPEVTNLDLVRRFEFEQGVRARDNRVPAGWLIDQARLRSSKIGAAMVSPRHANYLVNTGHATAEEMVRLAELVKAQVLSTLGVQLREEVSCVGFTPPAETPPS